MGSTVGSFELVSHCYVPSTGSAIVDTFMKNFIAMLFTLENRKIINWLLVLLLCLCGDVLPKKSSKSEVRAEYPKGCAYLRCNRGDQCVNRKFWCKNPPCPSMLYCSKSRKESLKGPTTCEAVRCSKGFICLVRARRCRWGEACEQQIARCVSEREYYEGPASCAEFRCPSGHRCILRESLCAKPPCKLLKSCANTKDVNSWFEGCKRMGCLSEHECFLRSPDHDCTNSHCKHAPDCLAKSEEELETSEHCRGWVCPKGQECSTHTDGPCKRDGCRISRSCHKPLIVPVNSTRPRKHSWRDDIKLSFYSKLEKDLSGKNNSSPRQTANKISRGSSPGNVKISSIKAGRKIPERPIYKQPVYISASARPTSPGLLSASPDTTSARDAQPTVTSLSTWLNHLKLKTGVDAIEVWIRKADKQESYREFREWLESVKDMLGPAAYDLWLEEVRAMTVTSTAFQKWLPPASKDRAPDTHHFAEQDSVVANFNNEQPERYPELKNAMKHRTNEEDDYFQGRNMNGKGYETELIKNDDLKEDDLIFPPHADPPTIKPEIALNNAVPTPAGFPLLSPTIATNEWSRFYPPDPRILQQQQQAYPFNQNFGNMAPWANQAPPFRGFDPTSLLNPWYQQFPANWSLPQSPVSNFDFLRPNTWQNQFVAHPHPQWQQERDLRDRFSTDRWIEPTNIPAEIPRRLMEEPVQYYSRNSTGEDTSWIKYFPNPYQTSRFSRPDAFGSFPITDGNFNGYVSWPGSSNQGPSSADVPHRRSKHEDSTLDFGHFRYAAGDEDRAEEKHRGMIDDSELYSSGFPWLIADPRLRDYYRYLVDYNRRNLNDKNSPKSPLPSPVVPSLSRSHRVDVEPRLPSPIRYFADTARGLPPPEYHWPSSYPHDQLYRIAGTPSQPPVPIALERQAVRARENDRRIDPFPKLNLTEGSGDPTRGFLFRNRDFEAPGQPMGVPDLWDPRYRTPLSSIVDKADGERSSQRDVTEKIVPVVTPRRRVAPNWIMPIAKENLHLALEDDYQEEDKSAEDNRADDDEEMPSLLLSLRGYIESPQSGSSHDSNHALKNLTIFPVYTAVSEIQGQDDCVNYHPGPSDELRPSYQQKGINFFKNPKYGGSPDFPKNLKSVFDVEAAMIMRNTTGERDVAIKGIKWEYEDEDEKFLDDPSSFVKQRQNSVQSADELSNINEARDWVENSSGARYDGLSENYYYDEGIDYEDDIVPGDRSYFDPEQINGYGSLNPEEAGDDSADRFYNDPDHRTFKKNRPL